MNLDLLKKNSIVEKEEAFMPIVFVDLSVPAAAIALNGSVIGHTIKNEFKKNIIAPLLGSQKSLSVPASIPVMSSAHAGILRSSILDIDF